MDLEKSVTERSTSSRREKSLGLLTMKFVSLLQEAKDGVLDLKVVSETVRCRLPFFSLFLIFLCVLVETLVGAMLSSSCC